MKTDTIHLLQQYNCLPFCTNLCKIFNTNTIVLLAELCKNQSENIDNTFKISMMNLSKNTGLTIYEIQSSLKILEKYDIVQHKRIGVPATNYYTIKPEQLQNILQTST